MRLQAIKYPLLLLVLTITGGLWFVFNRRPSVPPPDIHAETSGKRTITGDLGTLLGLDRSMYCTYEDKDDQGVIAGEIFLSVDKFSLIATHPDFERSYMVGDPEWIYAWDSGVRDGSRTRTNGSRGANVNGAVLDPAERENFICTPWIPDASKFALPSDIEFKEEAVESDRSVESQ